MFLLGVLRRGWGLLDLVYFEVFGRIDVNLVFAGFLATSDLHFLGLICFVLASPLTSGSKCCIYGALWALLSFLWSFIDPGTWVKFDFFYYSFSSKK